MRVFNRGNSKGGMPMFNAETSNVIDLIFAVALCITKEMNPRRTQTVCHHG